VTSGTILGAVRYGGYDGSAFTDLYAGELRGNATENWSTTAHGTSLNFGTIANGTTTLLDRMIIDQNGRVGIGTSTPNQQLEITNAFRFPSTTSSTTGVIYKDANRFIHNYKPAANDGNNTFVGVNAGNFTMTSATSWLASGNTGIGNNALAAITDAGYNTAVGNTALQAVTTGSYNTGLGNSALKANTTGAGNTAVGNNALQANTTAGGCTAVGNGALNSNTIGISNTAVGESTLNLNTTGTFNTTIGQASLRDNTTGSFNTGCGLSALQANTTGNYNTAVGVSSLVGNLTGNNNTAVGFDALVATTSSNNVGFGYLAGVGNTSGANNTFLGYNTGATNTTGSNNTLIGYQANVASSALTNAAAIGYNASVSVSNSFVLGGTGANAVNVGIGLTAPSVKLHQDGGNATATYHKFTAGTTTGQTASDGFDIGIDASGNAYLDQNENAAMVFNTNNAEQMQISSAGNILIGALTPGEVTGVAVVNQSASDLKDDVTITTYNTTTTPAFVIFKARGTAAAPTSLTNNETIGGFNANGYTGSAFTGLTAVSTTTASDFTTSFGADLTFKTSRSGTSSERMRIMSTGNVGIGVTAPSHILQINGQGRATNSAWATTSDRRLKDIDGTFDYGLKELLKINTVRFHYKKDNPLALPTDRAFQGIIAQDLQTVIPEAVTKMPDGYLTVSTDPVFWTMLNAIKELDAKVEALTNENTILKTKLAELDALKTDIEKIKKAIGIDTSAKK
jgi:hypothetical protein